MVATTVDGLEPRPYKLQVKPRRLDKGGEAINIVTLDKSTMEQVGFSLVLEYYLSLFFLRSHPWKL